VAGGVAGGAQIEARDPGLAHPVPGGFPGGALPAILQARDAGSRARPPGAALGTEERSGRAVMRLIIAILLPWLLFFTIGRPLAGIICLLLQITLIGWIPAALWAVYALSQYTTDQKIEEAGLDRE
jgi:uncharacterized membrane protein YqaE (UPF0057 family)